MARKSHRRQWRDYRTAAGGRPIRDFFETLSDEEAAEVVAAMKEVARTGLRAAKHLRGDIYEVRADAQNRSYRILFAAEGRFSHVLLSLVAFPKTDAEDAQESARARRRSPQAVARTREGPKIISLKANAFALNPLRQ